MEKEPLLPLSNGRTDSNLHVPYSLEDKSYVGILKRDIRQMGYEMGMNEEEIGKCHIIVSEMATNLIKYGEKGREILLKNINDGFQKGFEFISIDRGPGIVDLRAMLRDSISTSGTLGQGLGAIKRLSNDFDIFTQPGIGTILLSRVYKKTSKNSNKCFLDFGSILIAKPGQLYCGDNWGYFCKNKTVNIMVFDGLGHGIHAQEASSKALEIFNTLDHLSSPADILSHIHNNLKKTRGGVGCVLMIDNHLKTFTFCGVGNISCKTISHEENKTYISFNGIIGLNIPRINDKEEAWNNSISHFILHSDGIKENWNLNNYPGLLTNDPSVVAAIIYRDFSRQRDDVSIVVGRVKR